MDEVQFTLYIDESGDDLLYEVAQWDTNPALETHCTLLGTVIPHNQKAQLKDGLNQIKEKIFHTKEIVLHSIDIRFKRGSFVCFHYTPSVYELFKGCMNSLVNDLHPVLICSSLDKKKWVQKFPRKLYFKDDPYTQAFEYLLERYAHFLNAQAAKKVVGNLVMEDRGNKEKNKKLVAVLEHLKEHGTQYIKADRFERLNSRIEFQTKKFNIPGLQLSDYFVYPFYVNHKNPQSENNHYTFLEQFIYSGDYARYGFKKWPV